MQIYDSQRQMALAASAFLLIMWAMIAGTIPIPFTAFDWYAWFAIYGVSVSTMRPFRAPWLTDLQVLTVPLLPMIALNVNYRHSRFYQAWLFCATWILPTIGIIEMNDCGFFREEDACQGRNFFIVFAAAIGNPTLSSLALGQNRAWSTAGFVGFFCLLGGLFFNQSTTDKAFYRNSIYCEYILDPHC
jgi:hypothetical protein